MARRLKLLTGLSTLAFTGALAVGACSGQSEGEGEGLPEADAQGEVEQVTLSLGEDDANEGDAEGEGEGEGGESGTALSESDERVAYFAKLMLISGHLQAGGDLFREGDAAGAAMHMKHPGDEIYLDLQPAFETYETEGFERELNMLFESVTAGESEELVEANLMEARAAIRGAVMAASPTVKEMLLASAEVLRTAGKEYDVSVEDEKVVNAHEYQDAYGFVKVVVNMLQELEGEDAASKEAIALAREKSMMALEIVPSAETPKYAKWGSAPIYGAAATIEIAALGLE